MARYIKVNPLVAKYLQLENTRNTVSDGNYLCWQNDMLRFGPLTQLNDILVKIGGISLMPHEARSEQDGITCRPLPIATDVRFQQPAKVSVIDVTAGDNTNIEQSNGGDGENTQNTSEGTENGGNEEQISGVKAEGDQQSETADSDQQQEAVESKQTESKTKK